MASKLTRRAFAPPSTYPNATRMTALACRKSAGTLTAWWGTKNDRIMNSPMTAVMINGTSRFTRCLLLCGHPARESVLAQGLEDAPHGHRRQDGELHEVGALEAPHQLGL